MPISVARWRFLSPDLVKSGENWTPLAISFYFWLQAKFWRFSGDFDSITAAVVKFAAAAVETATASPELFTDILDFRVFSILPMPTSCLILPNTYFGRSGQGTHYFCMLK